jgi:hypothetical protein
MINDREANNCYDCNHLVVHRKDKLINLSIECSDTVMTLYKLNKKLLFQENH